MNASTDARLKIMKGQKHFDFDLVSRLLDELDAQRADNLHLSRAARIGFIGGHAVKTGNGTEFCEPVPVIEVNR